MIPRGVSGKCCLINSAMSSLARLIMPRSGSPGLPEGAALTATLVAEAVIGKRKGAEADDVIEVPRILVAWPPETRREET